MRSHISRGLVLDKYFPGFSRLLGRIPTVTAQVGNNNIHHGNTLGFSLVNDQNDISGWKFSELIRGNLQLTPVTETLVGHFQLERRPHIESMENVSYTQTLSPHREISAPGVQ